ncbi:hypothetical protein [Sediminibacterium salmoneum]|uniref:hypothetical protein n=1 Tax=Sediminibacterium salmoneum TaxID=426421 RepID=UPI00047A5208|nr:hypothetical protein [Sediminibacterium salmoneum]
MKSANVNSQQIQVKAATITAIITIILFSLFFYVRYQLPQPQEIQEGEGIEVNLGNAETGYGDIPVSGNNDLSQANSTNAEAAADNNNATEEVNNEDDIAVNKNKPAENKKSNPVVNNIPPTPKPKAVFSNNTNRNTASGGASVNDSYNNAASQGTAGGKGDQGKPTGNPMSDSYNGNAASGNGGSGGVSIRNGLDGRRITRLPSFEDDFNENAKVAVDITVNQSGSVISASINPKGTTTTNSSIRNIAIQKARTLKLNAAEASEQTGTLIFNFKLRN